MNRMNRKFMLVLNLAYIILSMNRWTDCESVCLVRIAFWIFNGFFIFLISVCLVRIVVRIFNGSFIFLISCLVGINGLIEPCSEFKGEKLESSQSSCPYVIVFVLFWHVNCSR